MFHISPMKWLYSSWKTGCINFFPLFSPFIHIILRVGNTVRFWWCCSFAEKLLIAIHCLHKFFYSAFALALFPITLPTLYTRHTNLSWIFLFSGKLNYWNLVLLWSPRSNVLSSRVVRSRELYNKSRNYCHDYEALITILLCIMHTHVLILIPIYNAHPYFSLKSLGKKVCIMHGKILYLCAKGYHTLLFSVQSPTSLSPAFSWKKLDSHMLIFYTKLGKTWAQSI